MDKKINKTLEKQLEILSKRSKVEKDSNKLSKLSKAMVMIVQCLQGERNQSFYGDSINHPYEVQLPIKDLIDLYAARGVMLRRSSHDHKK